MCVCVLQSYLEGMFKLAAVSLTPMRAVLSHRDEAAEKQLQHFAFVQFHKISIP